MLIIENGTLLDSIKKLSNIIDDIKIGNTYKITAHMSYGEYNGSMKLIEFDDTAVLLYSITGVATYSNPLLEYTYNSKDVAEEVLKEIAHHEDATFSIIRTK